MNFRQFVDRYGIGAVTGPVSSVAAHGAGFMIGLGREASTEVGGPYVRVICDGSPLSDVQVVSAAARDSTRAASRSLTVARNRIVFEGARMRAALPNFAPARVLCDHFLTAIPRTLTEAQAILRAAESTIDDLLTAP